MAEGDRIIREVEPQGRTLSWDGLYNVRDLGGHETPRGPTRFGAVVRSESLALLSEAGRAALTEYGVRSIIDLRSPHEAGLEAHPLASLPSYRNVPLMDDLAMEHVAGIPEVAQVMRRLAASPAVHLVHCRAGKDRTGVIIALLLDNAGADRASVVADYALSDRAVSPLYEIWARQAGVDPAQALEESRRHPSRPEALLGLFDHLDSRYGGSRQYLLATGLSEPELDSLAHLLAP
jgi:protein-tyrosine phosphatase